MSSKNKLQELLQKDRRKLPTYSTIKEGPHHEFRFRATVTLDNGLSFQSPSFYSTIKQAENAAADVAIDALRNQNHKPMQATVRNQPHALSSDSRKEVNKLEKEHNITIVEVKERKVEELENGLATSKSSMEISPAESELKDKISLMSQCSAQSLCSPNIDVFPSSRIQIVSLEEIPTSPKSGIATNKQMINNIDSIPESSRNNSNKEQGHNMIAYEPEIRQQDKELIQQSEGRISASPFHPEMHKNRLHEFAVRSGFDIPCYSCVREGPAHALRFKATVMFNGKAFQAPGFFSSLRQAEHAAAAVALNSLSEKSFYMDESSVCKNLLQEKAQKEGSPLPEYDTTISGQLHMPIFTCTVKFDGMTFEGKAAKTKKQAEKNAALVAWTALKEGRRSTTSTVQMLDKEKTLFCDANDSPNVQVHNHVNEEKLKQSHYQLCHVDKSTDLSVVSHSEHSQVFNTNSVKEPVHNMMNVPQNTCNDKAEQPGKKLLHTKYPRGTRIRVMPALEPIKWPLSANALSSSGRPWVAVILNDSTV